MANLKFSYSIFDLLFRPWRFVRVHSNLGTRQHMWWNKYTEIREDLFLVGERTWPKTGATMGEDLF